MSLQGFPPEGLREPFKPESLSWTQRFPLGTGGYNQSFASDSISPDEAVTLNNLRPQANGVVPVWGYTEISTPKASPTEVLNLNFYKSLAGVSRLIMLDEDDLRHWDGSAWATVTGGGAAMTGTDQDRIRSAMVLNTFIWVNGVDEPKTWAVGDASYSDLTADVNVPATARHVAAFADRVVFADIGTGASRNPQRLEWSASGAPTDFTSLGSGGATLFDTSDDSASDDIMALKVFDEYLVIFRQRSIWVGQRTGEVAAPIRFHSLYQGTGTVAEDSVQVVGDVGIIFLAHDNVYLFHPENRSLVPIGEPIRNRLFTDIDTSKFAKVRSAYVPHTKCYHLFFVYSGDTWAQRSSVFDVGRYLVEERFVWHDRRYTANTKNVTYAFGGQTNGLGATFTQRETKLLLGSDIGEVFETLSSATTDDGTAITWSFLSPDFNMGPRYIDPRKVGITYASTSNVTTLDLSIIVNGSTTPITMLNNTLTTPGTLLGEIEAIIWLPAGGYGRTFNVSLTDTVANTPNLRLIGYRLGFLQRGEITT